MFDIILNPCATEEKLEISIFPGDQKLGDWYNKLNHVDDKYKNIKIGFDDKADIDISSYRVLDSSGEISLLSLIFQLNQLLMLINNPIPFPHQEYAKMFNDYGK